MVALSPQAFGIIAALVLAVFALSVALCLVVQYYQGVVQDLLDRLMARNLDQYAGVQRTRNKTPLKRWCVTDAQAANKEREAAILRQNGSAK